MLDVSSPSTSISGAVRGLNASYTYCYAAKPGECTSKSAAGQWYANCPIGIGDTTQTYITLASAPVAKVSRIRWDDNDPNGRNIQATFPYLLELASQGLELACAHHPALSAGVNTYHGYVTHPGVAESQGRQWRDLEAVE